MDKVKVKKNNRLSLIVLGVVVSVLAGVATFYVANCTVAESSLVKEATYPLACKHQLALLYLTQKNETAQAAAIQSASPACKGVLIDLHCRRLNLKEFPLKENASEVYKLKRERHFTQCQKFQAK